MPPNAGSFRRIEVHLRENCCVGIPRHPLSCSVATTNLADRVANPVQRAIAELADGFGMAEAGPIIPPRWRRHLRHATRVAAMRRSSTRSISGSPAAPARPRADGWLTIVHVGNAGLCRHDSDRGRRARSTRSASTSAASWPTARAPARFRGAPGVRVEFGPIEGCRMRIFYTADGMINTAQGARGGGPGAPVRSLKREASGELAPQPACAGVELAPGETIVSVSSGGGGYGPAWARGPERVLHDVRERYVSLERAREVYGVIVTPDGGVDPGATALRRARLAGPGSGDGRMPDG